MFYRQIYGLGKVDDVLVCFSTSGNSKNIINALAAAKGRGLASVSFLGKDGGVAKNISDYSLIVENDNTARIQEVHQILMHSLLGLVDRDFGN